MIIRCDQCETQFQLDDARVPEAGVRVRCSRCKHAFHVTRPTDEPAVALEADDGQWEFSEEPLAPEPEDPIGADEPTVHAEPEPTVRAEPEPGDDRGVLTDPEAFQVEPTSMSASEDAAEGDPASDVGLDPESFFGDIGEEIAAMEAPPAAAGAHASAAPMDETSDAPLGLEPEGPAEEAAPAGSDSEELGSPDTWAFVADPPAADEDDEGDLETEPESAEEVASDETPAPERGAIDLGPAPAPLPGRFGALWARASHSAAPLIGCLCALVMASIALPQLVRVERPAPRVATAVQVGEFVAEHLSVRRLENRDGAVLLVVAGRLRNPTEVERSLGRALRVRLHGDAGPLELVAWAGAAQGERALRETRLLELLSGAPDRAGVLRARAIPAGSTVPFEAVFADPPSQARRAQIEVVSAS